MKLALREALDYRVLEAEVHDASLEFTRRLIGLRVRQGRTAREARGMARANLREPLVGAAP